jgi:hypothetical protein
MNRLTTSLRKTNILSRFINVVQFSLEIPCTFFDDTPYCSVRPSTGIHDGGATWRNYEGGSVNRSQMDVKRKTCDIRIWKKHFSTCSTNIDTLVPSLYQCLETRSIKVFWLLSQPLPHPISTSSSSAKRLPPSSVPLYATNTSYLKQDTFLHEYPMYWVLLPSKNTQQNAALG